MFYYVFNTVIIFCLFFDDNNRKKHLFYFLQCTDDSAVDADYDPKDYEESSSHYISLKYKEKVVALAKAHPKWSLATLQRNCCGHLKRKDILQRWKEVI